jgi:hypothetical protein
MVAVFLGREPLARVNTQPIALDARLALLLILATISNFQALLEIKVSPHFACAYWSQNDTRHQAMGTN